MKELLEYLEEAAKKIEEYASGTPCGWCKRKAEMMAQAVRDLKDMHVLGEAFVNKLGTKEALVLIESEAEKLRVMHHVADRLNSEGSTNENVSLFPDPREIGEFIRDMMQNLSPFPIKRFDGEE